MINISEAKKNIRSGKLHLDVPEESIGKIIGTKGANINAVTSILKEKVILVSKIILHPKSRDEMKTSMEQIKSAIGKNREIEEES